MVGDCYSSIYQELNVVRGIRICGIILHIWWPVEGMLESLCIMQLWGYGYYRVGEKLLHRQAFSQNVTSMWYSYSYFLMTEEYFEQAGLWIAGTSAWLIQMALIKEQQQSSQSCMSPWQHQNGEYRCPERLSTTHRDTLYSLPLFRTIIGSGMWWFIIWVGERLYPTEVCLLPLSGRYWRKQSWKGIIWR